LQKISTGNGLQRIEQYNILKGLLYSYCNTSYEPPANKPFQPTPLRVDQDRGDFE
jgi:hypothetical protein